MSLENAKVLHKRFLELGMKDKAEDQERSYPELKNTTDADGQPNPPKPEVNKDGKKPKGRTKRASNN